VLKDELARRLLAMDLSDGCEGKNARRMLEELFQDVPRLPEYISIDSGSDA
jgi:DNA mismatch repair protein MSH5